ncbi:hypothetical protein BJX76DRAFT_353903 [Aspergillus varians]
MEFPIISIKHLDADFDTISGKIFNASQNWGFFIITDHGITGVDKMFTLSQQFFSLPMAVKCEKPLNELAVGYDGHKATAFAASEGMTFGLPAGQLSQNPNLHSWWDAAKVAEIESFKSQCNDLTSRILPCFAVHMGLPASFFEASHNQPVLPGNALKFMKYPKMPARPDGLGARLTAHTDWGTLTLLFTKAPGLEVRDPTNKWHDVPVVPGGIVVNIGDALSFWTGRKLKSTMHRISWEKVPFDQDRYSIPYFVQPSFGTDLQPLTGQTGAESKPLLYQEYYTSRIRLTWGSVLSEDGDGVKQPVDVDNRLAQYLTELDAANALGSDSQAEAQSI